MFMVAPYVKLSLSTAVPQSDWSGAKNLLQIKLEQLLCFIKSSVLGVPSRSTLPYVVYFFHLVAMCTWPYRRCVNRALDRIHERETPVKFHLDHSWSCIFDVRESSRLQVSFLKVANGRGGNVAL
jgi:hypothetical protein